jgi:hypothetical protein
MSRGGRRGVPPDLKGTLGTLIRTTINQVGAMTDVARRQARSQKQRLDTALLERRRRDALADLGEVLYQLASNGEIELDELPELGQGVQEIAELEQRIAEAEEAARGRDEGRRPVRLGRTATWPEQAPGSGRTRDRARSRDQEPGRERARSRDQEPSREQDRERVRGRERDGGLGLDRGGRARTRSDSPSGRDWQRVWRPPVDPDPEIDTTATHTDDDHPQKDRATRRSRKPPRGRAADAPGPAEAPRSNRPGAPRGSPPEGARADNRSADSSTNRAGGGGIVFVDDDSAPADVDPGDSVESYMNEDDVPPRR